MFSFLRSKKKKLIQAVNEGDLELVKKLLKKGANPNTKDEYNVAIVSSSNSPSRWSTPVLLYAIAKEKSGEMAELLVNNGADVNVGTQDNSTPLQSAAWEGNANLVSFLLDRGAEINAAAINTGWTALHCAVARGHYNVVKELINRGANLSVRNLENHTPLTCARNNGNNEIAKLLKQKGASE